MPEIASTGIDAFALADAGQTLSGTLAAEKAPRLRAAALVVAAVQAELRFKRDPAGRCLVAGSASAEVTQTCQRCMEPVTFPVETVFTLVVVNSEAEANQLPDALPGGDPEPVIQEKRLMDIAALVEDELLLALPLIARHEGSRQCGYSPKEAPEPASQNKPFQVLKDMKLH